MIEEHLLLWLLVGMFATLVCLMLGVLAKRNFFQVFFAVLGALTCLAFVLIPLALQLLPKLV